MAVRYPRCWVQINEAVIPCLKVKVTKTSKRNASTFSAELSATKAAQYGIELADWADFQPTDVAIIVSLAPNQSDATTMIVGQVDKPKINWDAMTISLSGRDKSAGLIEKRRSQTFPNQKSSDICSTIAADNGLNPVVTDTGDFAGKSYNSNDQTHLVVHRTDYEVLSDLADREGYRWYVDGYDLHFEPKEPTGDIWQVFYSPPGVVAPYAVGTPVKQLETWRNMTAAKPHTVNVKSFHHKDKTQYNAAATADGVGDPINIDHHHNMRSQSQSQTLATSRLKDAIRHDCNARFKAPLDLTVTPFMQAQLNGTSTIFDQIYDIDTITADVSWESGADMDVECKAPKSGRSISTGTSSDGADSAPGDGGSDSGSSSSSANGGNVSPGPGGGAGFGTNGAGGSQITPAAPAPSGGSIST